MISISITDADGVTTAYPVPSSAADTNWAAPMIAFLQALAANVGPGGVPDCSGVIAGKVNLVDQTMGAGIKTFEEIHVSIESVGVQQLFGGSTVVNPPATVMNVNNAPTIDVSLLVADRTLTGTPSLSDGVEGQEVLISNRTAFNFVLQDEGTLPGSKLRLSANTITLTGGSNVRLRWLTDTWYQVGGATLV